MQKYRYYARLTNPMSIKHRQLTAWLLSIVMVFGHLGSAMGQVMATPMPGVMSTSQMAGQSGMHMTSVSGASTGHQLSSMPTCHTGQCAMCDHCAMSCVGLLSCPLSLQYPVFAFDALAPRLPHPPLLVFSFLRPPDSSLT